MAVGIDGVDRTFKNIAELSFRNLRTDLVLNLPKPSDFVIQRNFGQRRVPTVTATGIQTFSDNYIVAEDPQLQVIYSQWQPEIIGLKMGTIFETATTKTIRVSKSIDAYQTGVALPLNIGGDNVTINSFSASYTNGNVSVDATALVTVDLILKTVSFDASLLNQRVTFQFDVDVVNGLASTAAREGSFSIYATLVATDDELVFVEIPKATINFEGAALVPSAEQVDLNFFINTVAGRCEPYDILYSGEYIQC